MLQIRIAVHFQGIEILVVALCLLFVAEQNLGFGFDFQLAQLITQTTDRLVQLGQIETEVADLLLHT